MKKSKTTQEILEPNKHRPNCGGDFVLEASEKDVTNFLKDLGTAGEDVKQATKQIVKAFAKKHNLIIY